MDFEYNDKELTITVDEDEQAELTELGTSDDNLAEAFEDLTSNSELQWINPEDTGDLTDAPMLGILGDESPENKGPYGAVWQGGDANGTRWRPIIQRWAYMDYQIRSPIEDLINNGKVVFVSS